MKEKQPYEKPKMTFVENQPERRKSLKKEKIVPVRFTNWQYECPITNQPNHIFT